MVASEVRIRLDSGTEITLRFEHGQQAFGGAYVEGICRVQYDRAPSQQDKQDADYLVREALAEIGWKDVHQVPNRRN